MVRKFLLVCVGTLVLGASAAYAFPPIDLTTLNSTYTGADGVIWNEIISVPTGTGVYDPFLRVQATNVEEGFNTNWGGPYDPVGSHQPPLDDKGGIWTHDLRLKDLQVYTKSGVDYYVFSLDINEPNNDPDFYLSLDELRLYTSTDYGYDTLAHMQAHSTLRYDMDASISDGMGGYVDQDVYLNHSLQAGSGHDDMEVLIPTSYFTGAGVNDYLFLYCKFGATGGAFSADFQSGDGFEEWHALLGENPPPPPGAPEPSTMLLLGGGLVGLLAARNRRK
jgi:hypothetical protein